MAQNRPPGEWDVSHAWRVCRRFDLDLSRPVSAFETVLDGLFTFAGDWVQMLELCLTVDYIDEYGCRATGYEVERPEWHLKVAGTPTLGDEPYECVPRIDRATLEWFIATACDQAPNAEGEPVAPVLIYIAQTRVRVPAEHDEGGAVLQVRSPGCVESLPLTRDGRGAWVDPGDSQMPAPLTLQGSFLGITAQLDVHARWDPWYDDGEHEGAGLAMLRDAIGSLTREGWTLEQQPSVPRPRRASPRRAPPIEAPAAVAERAAPKPTRVVQPGWFRRWRMRPQPLELSPAESLERPRTVDGGRIVITEAIEYGAASGRFRGHLRDEPARRCLITTAVLDRRSATEVRRAVELPIDGVAECEFVGPVDAPDYEWSSEATCLVEHEPDGAPLAAAIPIVERDAIALGLQLLELVQRAHAAASPIRGIRPELVYVDDDLRLTGVAPGAIRLRALVERPAHGLPILPWIYGGLEEVVRAQPDPRTDVYSICATLYVATRGVHPLGEFTPQQLGRLSQASFDGYPGSRPLSEVINAGLAVHAAHRLSVADLTAALSKLA